MATSNNANMLNLATGLYLLTGSLLPSPLAMMGRIVDTKTLVDALGMDGARTLVILVSLILWVPVYYGILKLLRIDQRLEFPAQGSRILLAANAVALVYSLLALRLFGLLQGPLGYDGLNVLAPALEWGKRLFLLVGIVSILRAQGVEAEQPDRKLQTAGWILFGVATVMALPSLFAIPFCTLVYAPGCGVPMILSAWLAVGASFLFLCGWYCTGAARYRRVN